MKSYLSFARLGISGKFILLISLLTLRAEAHIVKASSVSDIETRISKFNGESTLVLFDLDYVLFAPKDKVLRYAGEENNYRAKHFKAIFERFKDTEIEVEEHKMLMTEYLLSGIMLAAKVELVSPRMPDFIRALNSRKFTVVGFTANSSGKYGVISNEAQLHLLRLKSLGYNSFEDNRGLFAGNFPSCISRVIFTNKANKGEIILQFLKSLNKNYKNIIFVDDRKKNLISVQDALENSHINYLGIHYTELQERNEKINLNIADKQFQILLKEHIWLSDEEASAQLATNNR